ncbi:hypothetical protein HG535_0G01570 [Zygotorulaspora mrakii]|uniref:Uncharacterized protein n=1 Tax=Zygotorulaspora mrakii TaxID=42260 RepID=A0A7H9B6Y9_ZYGMR|nr:uncharacterized protein HG535_0G01570 [Zygotorulaspora mrakii]QLG74273.1 hypothetical protein HG535_0G01570 [Zygotorulaspora mrakii]
MRTKRSRSISYQLVTPEEPVRDKTRGSEDKNEVNGANNEELESSMVSDGENGFFMPSIKNTRELETEILDMIHILQKQETPRDRKESETIISLLNRSITAISHWSLQAQLAQLRANVDDRQTVENNLLRKEMELLISKRSDGAGRKRRKAKLPASINTKVGYLKSPPYVTAAVSEASPPRRSLRKHASLTSPTSTALDDPVSLKLVESNKPHPRMKRNSDNPSTNEYVRVFHLQRE